MDDGLNCSPFLLSGNWSIMKEFAQWKRFEDHTKNSGICITNFTFLAPKAQNTKFDQNLKWITTKSFVKRQKKTSIR